MSVFDRIPPDAIRQLYDGQGMTIVQISKHFKSSPETIRSIMKSSGIKTRIAIVREQQQSKPIPFGPFSTYNSRHGYSHTPTYKAWKGMKQRVRSKSNKTRKYYLDAGITFCERWSQFENFLDDMGFCPEGHTLERINNSGNYEPGNCKWATYEEQNGNRRQSVRIKYNGENLWLCEWARRLDVDHHTLMGRINRYGIQVAFSYDPVSIANQYSKWGLKLTGQSKATQLGLKIV